MLEFALQKMHASSSGARTSKEIADLTVAAADRLASDGFEGFDRVLLSAFQRRDLTFSEAAVGAGQKPFAAMFLERQWHFPACTHYEKHDFGRFSKMMYDCGPSIQWKG